MKRIEDEPIKFYLEHRARIREWAGLEAEVRKFADRFYGSLKDDLDAALRTGQIADEGVESFFTNIRTTGDWASAAAIGRAAMKTPTYDWNGIGNG